MLLISAAPMIRDNIDSEMTATAMDLNQTDGSNRLVMTVEPARSRYQRSL